MMPWPLANGRQSPSAEQRQAEEMHNRTTLITPAEGGIQQTEIRGLDID
jgi:hypothetical protein